jgi:hypothetical protein
MAKMQKIRLVLLGMGILGMSLAVQGQATTQTPSSTAPAPAFGQENTPILNPENPPVSGVDEPRLELRTATRSFVSPALQVSESADTNGENQVGGNNGVESVSRVLGALDLQQFWPKSDLFLEYLGGGAFYSSPYRISQLQAAGLEGVTRWRTGQATLRDSFSYLPDGAFSIGTFGGVPGFGIATGSGSGLANTGLPGNLSNSLLGSVANIPRLANTAIADVVQAISPVAALTFVGGFSNAHFYDPTNELINSDQITAEGGYSRLISRHDQLGAVYAFQLFQFPQATGGQIYNNILNIRWSHTITGRMSLIAGLGPQYTELEQGGYLTQWTVSGRVQLRYKFAHSAMVATWEKFTSSGSGFFAGANTQAARLGYQRPIGRTWELYADLSYSHNERLQTIAGSEVFGVGASSYDEGSASAVLRKHIGRVYEFFAAYRFSEVAFNTPVTITGSTGRIANRNVATVGIEWHPTPTRIE